MVARRLGKYTWNSQRLIIHIIYCYNWKWRVQDVDLFKDGLIRQLCKYHNKGKLPRFCRMLIVVYPGFSVACICIYKTTNFKFWLLILRIPHAYYIRHMLFWTHCMPTRPKSWKENQKGPLAVLGWRFKRDGARGWGGCRYDHVRRCATRLSWSWVWLLSCGELIRLCIRFTLKGSSRDWYFPTTKNKPNR